MVPLLTTGMLMFMKGQRRWTRDRATVTQCARVWIWISLVRISLVRILFVPRTGALCSTALWNLEA